MRAGNEHVEGRCYVSMIEQHQKWIGSTSISFTVSMRQFRHNPVRTCERSVLRRHAAILCGAAYRDCSRFVGWKRSAEEEALQLRAAGSLDVAALVARLDTLRSNVGADACAEADDRGNDRGRVRVIDLVHE